MGNRWRFENYSLLAQAVQKALIERDTGWAWRVLTEAVADSPAASDIELSKIVQIGPNQPENLGLMPELQLWRDGFVPQGP